MNYEIFKSIGLEEKAAKIYLSTVGLGTTSVHEIALKSGLKRPTVYIHLDELVRLSLIEKIAINKKKYYRAIDPAALEKKIKNNLEQFQTVISTLKNEYSNTVGQPQVRVFQGTENIKQIYDEISRSSNFCIWSNVGSYRNLFGREYEALAEKMKENGAGVKEIIADTNESRKFSKNISKLAGRTYQARVATCEGIENDTFICNNVVLIFRLHELNMFVVRIEDQTIADTMRAMFAMAWKSAKPLSE